MGHALVRGGDTAGGAVVVRAVVQPGAPPGGGMDQPGNRYRAVGREYGCRRLDLELEAQPVGRQPVRPLEPSTEDNHRLDLCGVADLRQRDDEAVRWRAQLVEEQVECTD